MHRISSNSTLFLKIFLPTFWMVFFGIFTIAICFVSEVPFYGSIPANVFKICTVAFFLAGSALLYFSLMQLMRVELDSQYLYASNYFKTYRYPYDSIEKIIERDLGLFHLTSIYLKEQGRFGKKISFLLDEEMWRDFLKKNPEAAKKLSSFEIKTT